MNVWISPSFSNYLSLNSYILTPENALALYKNFLKQPEVSEYNKKLAEEYKPQDQSNSLNSDNDSALLDQYMINKSLDSQETAINENFRSGSIVNLQMQEEPKNYAVLDNEEKNSDWPFSSYDKEENEWEDLIAENNRAAAAEEEELNKLRKLEPNT